MSTFDNPIFEAAENLYGPLLRETERQIKESENLKRMRIPTALERNIDKAITDFKDKHGCPNYMIVNSKTFNELERLGAIDLFEANPFFGEEVAYVTDSEIKVITQNDVEDFLGEEGDKEYLTHRLDNPLALVQTGWFTGFKEMSFYDLEVYH